MLRLLQQWRQRKDGSTAIEFSLMFLPFMMLTLGIIEISIMYTSASLLEGATGAAARMIRTGQLQQSGSADPESDFRDAMCGFATALIQCEDIIIEVVQLESYDDFPAATYDSDGNLESQGFDAGGANDRILIRTAYRYSMVTPLVGPLINGSDGSTLFVSTIVLQTEPYEFQGS